MISRVNINWRHVRNPLTLTVGHHRWTIHVWQTDFVILSSHCWESLFRLLILHWCQLTPGCSGHLTRTQLGISFGQDRGQADLKDISATCCGVEQELFVHCPKVEVCNCGIKGVEQKEYYSDDCWERWVQEEAADLRWFAGVASATICHKHRKLSCAKSKHGKSANVPAPATSEVYSKGPFSGLIFVKCHSETHRIPRSKHSRCSQRTSRPSAKQPK